MNPNSTLFNTKRDSLQDFVREQLIGPVEDSGSGAFEGRFGFDEENGDIVDATPGTIYCSGILFPKKSASKEVDTKEDESGHQIISASSELEGQAQNDVTNQDDDDDDDVDDLTITQRYPNLFGISCCINKQQLTTSDFAIIVSGRHYCKVLGNSILHLFVRVPTLYIGGVNRILSNPIIAQYYRLDGNRLYLTTADKLDYSTITDCLDNLDKDLASQIISSHAKQLNSIPIFSKPIKLSTYRDYVFEAFKKESKSNHDLIKSIMSEVESCEASLHFFRLILPAIQPHGYGFWKAQYFKKRLVLDGMDFSLTGEKRILSHKDFPSQLTVIEIPISDDVPNPKSNQKASLSVSLQLLRDHKSLNRNKVYVKAMVENTSSEFIETDKLYYSIATEGVNIRSFFGVRIEIESENLTQYRSLDTAEEVDKETEQLRYLYRKIDDWGVGHFCSVSWEDKSSDSVRRVWSDFMPFYDIPDVDTIPQRIIKKDGEWITESRLHSPEYLKMQWLSTLSQTSNDDILKGLHRFVDSYSDWINETIVDSDNPDKAKEIKIECEKDRDRMLTNISILSSHADNLLAFRLMNTAMFMQLWQNHPNNQETVRSWNKRNLELTEDFYKGVGENLVPDIPICWRPFQLAFILLNIDGIIQGKDDSWEHRNKIVDLVWFPTGGGKTEAYLGIIALTILYRRLSNKKQPLQGDGTTAIMRYTLRLLTTQQFQRATRLIFALEQIRQWHIYDIGNDSHPISIGLYIGNDSLPNKKSGTGEDSPGLVQEAERWQKGAKDTKIPFVHHTCPWCGSNMSWDNNSKEFRCESTMCAFHDRLPVLLCDDDIYKNVPTLLFGTVDKFAAIARKAAAAKTDDSRRLFKTSDGLTPDLIIQDELHLLQGPLGSADGLFECALDAISTRELTRNGVNISVRPKIISSTATTRNTELQIRALYDRRVNVFPKNGIDYDDSFFAFYKRDPNNAQKYASKRRYFGILPTGRTEMYMQIRLASCLLTHRALFEDAFGSHCDFEDVANYYYSIVSYFGSLRDVGSTDAQFVTEFPKYVRQIFHRVIVPHGMLFNLYANNGSLSSTELTGRLDGPGVIEAFGKVEKDWEKDESLPYYDTVNRKPVPAPTPPDLIMATNMISVGLDVSRLNTMIINSMPRNKAEYIQATSRVARKTPGIVFTIHNPFRARDVSHFERFREFHEKLYYYVEPISITPFSTKTIQLFMPLFFAAFVRHKFDNLADNKDARNLGAPQGGVQPTLVKKEVMKYFQNLLKEYQHPSFPLELKGLFTNESLKEIEKYVDNAIAYWLKKIAASTQKTYGLYYKWDNDNEADSLFVSANAYEEEKCSSPWVIQLSLRIIPPESVVSIID